jgi:hypothetical protein
MGGEGGGGVLYIIHCNEMLTMRDTEYKGRVPPDLKYIANCILKTEK